ncbi:MAG TPA: molybdopterin cofactor-binding domain-containing protein [Alphaproteobacteria bacterium]|nr:molybdopterin cofactor-binding domain-containing protein [Alphaproteobacteria bacterium]
MATKITTTSKTPHPFEKLSLSRRNMLQAAGCLIVTAAGPLPFLRAAHAQEAGAAAAFGGPKKPPLVPNQLDSWIAIAPDGGVTAFFGKMDMGQGVDVAVAQIVAEELDVAFPKVNVIMGDTATTVNQGGASGSTGVQQGAQQLRTAAAEARRLLVDAAAKKLRVSADSLVVTDGVVMAKGNAAKKVSYGELIGGRYFDSQVEWNKKWGNPLRIKAKAKPKKVEDYKIVGKSMPRADVAGKVYGTTDYVTDVRIPGMVHARVIRPPIAGQVPASVDAASIKGTGAKIVRVKDFLAVVADKEWNAIRAAQSLKVTWKGNKNPFPAQDSLYDHIRKAKPTKEQVDNKSKSGDVDAAFKSAARTITAEYEWPFQSHSSMGPGCAVVEIKGDHATVFTGSQKPHYTADCISSMAGIPVANVHAIWVPGPGSYGRNDAGDVAAEAAVIAKAIGRPVRVQSMRNEGTGWDPKAPASVSFAKAALDKNGNVVAYDFMTKGFSRLDVSSHESHPQDLWVGQVLGADTSKREYVFGFPSESYKFANKRLAWQTIAPLLDRASPLRTSHMRDPLGPQLHFASESFADEMAHAAGVDPVAFRLKHVSKDRDKAVIQAAAEKAGWRPHNQPQRMKGPGGTLVGHGIAYTQRNGTVVAIVAEIEVDPASGRIWGRKFTVAHDCGLIINPGTLHNVIEGNVTQAFSRSVYEEVMFDRQNVASIDWATYPIGEMSDTPGAVDIVLINRPDVAPSGAGESATRPMAGALANAFFDATGVRIRRAPLTPERVKSALEKST